MEERHSLILFFTLVSTLFVAFYGAANVHGSGGEPWSLRTRSRVTSNTIIMIISLLLMPAVPENKKK
jgi:hypothetical protein